MLSRGALTALAMLARRPLAPRGVHGGRSARPSSLLRPCPPQRPHQARMLHVVAASGKQTKMWQCSNCGAMSSQWRGRWDAPGPRLTALCAARRPPRSNPHPANTLPRGRRCIECSTYSSMQEIIERPEPKSGGGGTKAARAALAAVGVVPPAEAPAAPPRRAAAAASSSSSSGGEQPPPVASSDPDDAPDYEELAREAEAHTYTDLFASQGGASSSRGGGTSGQRGSSGAAPAARAAARAHSWVAGGNDGPQALSDIRTDAAALRIPLPGPTGAEVARVLGGGLVPGEPRPRTTRSPLPTHTPTHAARMPQTRLQSHLLAAPARMGGQREQLEAGCRGRSARRSRALAPRRPDAVPLLLPPLPQARWC